MSSELTFAEKVKAAAANRGRMDLRGCAPCRAKMLKAMKERINNVIGLVIATRGDAQLPLTVASARAACPGLRILLVDDTDDGRLPERDRLISLGAQTVRYPDRLGCARARFAGAAVLLRDSARYVIFADDHMAFHDDDPRVREFRKAFAGFHIPEGIFERIAHAAAETGGIAYCGCNEHYAAELTVRAPSNNVPRCHWTSRPESAARTTGLMGAGYGLTAETYNRLGGWLALPGHIGWDEEAMSIHAARCGVPITCLPDVQTWHEFDASKRRDQGYRYDRYQVNLAAMWRLLMGDAAWARIRQRLATDLRLDGNPAPVPEQVLREAESPALLAYGESLRARHVERDDEAFLKSLGWEI